MLLVALSTQKGEICPSLFAESQKLKNDPDILKNPSPGGMTKNLRTMFIKTEKEGILCQIPSGPERQRENKFY